jgi:hypothetical protein
LIIPLGWSYLALEGIVLGSDLVRQLPHPSLRRRFPTTLTW